MRKALLIILSFWVISVKAVETTNLSGTWLFFFAKDARAADDMVARGFYKPGFDLSECDFKPIAVPSNWAVLGYEEPRYRSFQGDSASEGLYVRRFTIPVSFKGTRLRLHFGGVWASAEVWLNGIRLGRHDSGFTSFTFDITKEAVSDGDNVLAVRVRQAYPGYKTDCYDDWILGGIYRDVTIESMPKKRWIDYVHVVTRRAGESAFLVSLKTMVADRYEKTAPGNYPSPGKDYALSYEIISDEGETVADTMAREAAHTGNFREQRVTFFLAEAHLWSAEKPYLYTIRVSLVEDGVKTHVEEQKIGLREITIEDGVFKINGTAVKLRGVNRHDEYPDVGRATTHAMWLEDLTKMKAANINYVRACHYQHAKGFIQMCDSIGMYVGAEVSLGGAGALMIDPAYIPNIQTRVVETVERDINNPSIIYWSVGNEDCLTTQFLEAVKTVKALDPTRPVLLPWNADERLPEDIDILAPHYWTAAEYDSLARHSSRPVISTEWVHAYGTQRFGGLEDVWEKVMDNPHLAGGAVWMWADQGLRTPTKKVSGDKMSDDPYLRISSAGWDGVTDSYRNPTRDYEELKAVYCPITVKEVNDGDIELYNGYDFTNLNEVAAAYKLFVDDKIVDHGENIRLDAAPHCRAVLKMKKDKCKHHRGETLYAQLFFTDKNGGEIGRRGVCLDSGAAETGAVVPAAERPTVSREKENIIVSVKKDTFTFSRSTGLLKDCAALSDLRPAIWHKLNEGDMIIKNRSLAKGQSFETFREITVKAMSVKRESGAVVILSDVDYVINDSNTITAHYVSAVNADGSLKVDYALTPNVQTNYLPLIGMAVTPKGTLRWFGLGPDEAFPNKQCAEIIGLWDGESFEGTRQARWVEIGDHRIFLLGEETFIDRDSADSAALRLLSRVLGRTEKGRLNDHRYRVEPRKTYSGAIIIN